MKNLLAVSILATLLAACADSGQGTAPETETGSSAEINVSEPGVAAEPGTRPVVSTGAVTETPARPMPVPEGAEAKPDSSSNPLPPQPQSEPESPQPNEQGAQLSPEPRTGDDANPDAVNPRP